MLLKEVCHILTNNLAIFLERGIHKLYRYTNLLGNNTHVAGLHKILLKFDGRNDKSM